MESFVVDLSKSLTTNETFATPFELCRDALSKIRHPETDVLSEIMQQLRVESLKIETGCVINKENKMQQLDYVANIYILLNLFKALLNSKLPPIDRLTKVTFKKNYALKEKTLFENLLKSFEMQNEIYSNTAKTLHPLCAIIETKIANLREKIVQFGKYIAVRPEDVKYASVIKVSQLRMKFSGVTSNYPAQFRLEMGHSHRCLPNIEQF